MSQVLYLDPIGGIAGDMFLAAAVDLGAPLEAIAAALSGLGLQGWHLESARAERHAIVGTHVKVRVEEGHGHHPHHRPLSEIRRRIEGCTTLSPAARERALRVFQLLGEAEAKIHGVAVDAVEFHEVGAVDSIVDICGAAAALDLLGSPRLFCGAPPLGSGQVSGAHGSIPVPAPATLEVLRGVPVRFEGVGELTTPTGAALARALAEIGPPPELVVERIGYGVGTRSMADRPNVLRAVLGRAAHDFASGTWVLETNLDDSTPQLVGALMETLLREGALDAYVIPVTMKKSRPGHLLGVVAPGDRRDALIELLLRESTTLGVRFTRTERVALERRIVELDTAFGKVRVKLGLRGTTVLNAFPEFDDCRERAETAGVPVKDVWLEALAKAQGLR